MTARESLLAEADGAFQGRGYEKALEIYRRAAETAEAGVKAEALSQVARCLSLLRRLDEGRGWLDRARALASPEAPLAWSRYLGVRGIYEREGGEPERAKATFIEMYRFCRETGLHARAIDAAHHAAIVAPPQEQVEWARRGIEAAEAAGDEKWLAVLWNNLGATFEDLKRYPEALEAYVKAREYHHRTGDALNHLIADWAVGHASRLAGKPAEARTWLEGALRQARERRADEWIGYSLQDLAELALSEGRRQEGLAGLRNAREAFAAAGLAESWPEGWSRLETRIAELER